MFRDKTCTKRGERRRRCFVATHTWAHIHAQKHMYAHEGNPRTLLQNTHTLLRQCVNKLQQTLKRITQQQEKRGMNKKHKRQGKEKFWDNKKRFISTILCDAEQVNTNSLRVHTFSEYLPWHHHCTARQHNISILKNEKCTSLSLSLSHTHTQIV